MRKDTFYFMRKQPVDLLRYLPTFLAKDENFKRVQDTLSWEHESYRLRLVDIAKQFFVDTATWGLPDWEEFLLITPLPGATLEARRAAVRAKLLGGVLLNRKRMQDLVELFAPYGEVTVTAIGDCLMRIIIHNGTFYWDELLNALGEYLPAHISLIFDIEIEPDPEFLHVAQIINNADEWLHDLIFNVEIEHRLRLKNFTNDASENIVDLDDPAVECELNLNAGFIVQMSTEEVIPADYDYDETAELFEQYIRRKWEDFKHNPVVQHYASDANEFDNEFDYTDPDAVDPFPPAGDFLKLYWGFNNPRRIRSVTLFQPRDNISATEINAVGYFTVANQILVNRKGEPATELKSAFLVTKQVDWILPPPMRGNRRPPPPPPKPPA